jgi:hypothetical protein
MSINLENQKMFEAWAKDKDLTAKIPYCRKLTEYEVCWFLSFGCKIKLVDIDKFYRGAVDMATAVAEEYYIRWSTGIGRFDNWFRYESHIPQVIAAIFEIYVPGVITKYYGGIIFGDDSSLPENIIARYNIIHNEHEQTCVD